MSKSYKIYLQVLRGLKVQINRIMKGEVKWERILMELS